MTLPEISVRRPYTILMIFLAILLISLITIPKIPIDLMPNIEPPVITVIVPYPGASASDVENDITKYLEDQLTTVEDIDEINSISKDNISIVSCKFKWGKNLDSATNDIRDKVDLAKTEIYQHAPDAEEPLIFKFSTSMTPVAIISIASNTLWKDLYYITDKQISDRLKKAEGVGSVMLFGGLKRQIKIYLDWEKIKGYGIPIELIYQRLKEENIDFPLGEIKTGRRNYFLRVTGRFRSPDEINDILILSTSGKNIYLKDIARIEDHFEEEKSKGYINGKEAIILVVQKQSGRNTVIVANNIKKKIEEIKNYIPKDIDIQIVFDSSEIIIRTIKNLINTAITAGILVIIVTVLFLRKLNLSFIVVTSIPFSLICAFLFLYLGGFTINVISLMSLTIVIGMVVDNSIVILENIVRNFEKGADIKKSSVFGAEEIATAIIASSLTTIVVFFPLILIKGFIGIMFKQLAFIITTTIFMSMIIALTLVPMLCSILIKPSKRSPTKFYKMGEVFLKKLDEIYTKIIKFCLNNPGKFLSIISLIFIFSLSLTKFIGTEFFPQYDMGRIETSFALNPSSRLEQTDKIAKKIGKIYQQEIPERKFWYANIGESGTGFSAVIGREEGPYAGQVSTMLVWREERKRSDKEIAEILRKRIKEIPGIERFTVSTGSGMEAIFTQGASQIEIELYGSDIEKLNQYAEILKEKIKKIQGAINIKTSYKGERLEFHIKIDKEKAKTLGISTAQISQTIRGYIYGFTPTKYRESGEDFDVFMQLEESQRYNIMNIEKLPIFTHKGQIIKLKDIAKIDLTTGPIEINRKNRERIIKIGCDTYKRAMSEVFKDIEDEIKNLNIPPDIRIKFGGMLKEQRESFADLRVLLILGIVLVYMVMVGLFESFKTPFIIFFSIPFTFIGVVWFTFLTGVNFSIVSFMGMIMLMGVVVNNAIVLVDYINTLRKRGLNLVEAIIEGGRTRLRPIMMTSLSTIFGILPLAIGRGTGGEMWRGFGITAIGGFLVSWLISLVLVPVIYLIMNRKSVS
ncbi:MAG: efflux RND transporter permease subunit [Candidatus Omnitrophica bacterium]|nr:efflux RND transporter permease subunit [Candidatus Omnitrophota bacterium]MCM8802440.1 efflux RND transporter permease subunit [Candidatus Omnitrophota bacterium]